MNPCQDSMNPYQDSINPDPLHCKDPQAYMNLDLIWIQVQIPVMHITEIRQKFNHLFYHLRHKNFPDGNIRDFSLFRQHVRRHPRQEVQDLQRGLLHPAPQGDDEILKKDAGTQKNAGAIEKWEQLVKKKGFQYREFL